MLELLQATALTWVQDLGRCGARHLGWPPGGAMDSLALQRANVLVGNAPEAAALEFCAGPLHLRLQRDAWVALQGANFELLCEGAAQPVGLRCPVRAGQTLSLRGPRTGLFAVLAVDGGLRAEPGPVRAGAALPLGPAQALSGRRGLRERAVDRVLALLPGPEFAQLEADAQQRLFAQAWQVGPHSDRMGLRLQGVPLRRHGAELLSHAVQPGLVQLPPDGQPIVLAAGAASTGGYPRIGQVAAADQWKLAQLRPGDALRFEAQDLDTARQRWAAQQQEIARWRRALTST